MKNNFFRQLVSEKNDINEKSFVGVVAFFMMIVTLITDIATGVMGQEMPIHEFIYDGFLIIVLGSFGIDQLGKVFNRNKEG
jgi:hypothetical protein